MSDVASLIDVVKLIIICCVSLFREEQKDALAKGGLIIMIKKYSK